MGDVVSIEFASRADVPRAGERWLGFLAHGFLIMLITITLFDSVVISIGLMGGKGLLSIGPGSAYLGAPHGPGIVPFDTLPLSTRLAYATTLLLDTTPALIALFELWALLRRFEVGHFFEDGSRRRIVRAAIWLVMGAAAPAVGRVLVAMAGHVVDKDWLHASSLFWLAGACILLAFSRVLREGLEIGHDLKGIV